MPKVAYDLEARLRAVGYDSEHASILARECPLLRVITAKHAIDMCASKFKTRKAIQCNAVDMLILNHEHALKKAKENA